MPPATATAPARPAAASSLLLFFLPTAEHDRWTPAALAGMGLVLAGRLLLLRAKERASFPPARQAD